MISMSLNKTGTMKKRPLFIRIVKWIFFPVLFICAHRATAQPFLDVISLKYANSPSAGKTDQNNNKTKLQYLAVNTNLPIRFKNKKDAIIFSPFYEEWWSKINNGDWERYHGLSLPVSLVKSIPYTRWSVLLNVITRLNDSSISKRTSLQVGGAFVVNYKRTDKLTWKLGVYMNNELFGVFVMPLAGIDWKINDRNNLFGILPGSLTYEHKINDHFYYGATFRAITNSYGRSNGYWRIDENQLGLYLDTYLNQNWVFTAEAGHSLLRKIRTGLKHVAKYDREVDDNLYFRVSVAYRVRFKR
jgi:hypothetical protein